MIQRFAFGLVAFAMLGFSPALAQNNGGDQQQGGGGNGQGQNQGGGGGQQPGPGGNGRQRGGGRGGNRQALADQLKDVLTLTDDEMTKIKALDESAQQDMQKLRDDMRNQGGGGGGGNQQNFQVMRDKMQELVTKERASVREILTDDQKTKFDDWVKQQDAQRQQRGRRGQNGQNMQPGQNGRGRGGDPAARTQRLLDEAEKALTLSPDEKSVVMPLIKALLEAKAALRDAEQKRRDELTNFMKEKKADTDKDEIAAKLKDFRKANDGDRDKVKQAQAALCEVLTVDNETKLASLGIID